VQNDRQAIQFGLQQEIGLSNARVKPENALIPGKHVLAAESIGKAQDRGWMSHFFKFFRDLTADFLGWRIRGDEFRMLRFNRFETVEELIVFKIRNLGLVERVVQVIVIRNFLPQFGKFLEKAFIAHCRFLG